MVDRVVTSATPWQQVYLLEVFNGNVLYQQFFPPRTQLYDVSLKSSVRETKWIRVMK